MAKITIDIPDTALQRVIDGLCKRFNYENALFDGSKETKAEFSKRMIIEFIRSNVIRVEKEEAAKNVSVDAADLDSISVN